MIPEREVILDSNAILETAASLRRAGKPFALATVVRCDNPTSAKPGAKAIIEPDGTLHGWIGGGCAQPAVVKAAKKALREGRPYLVHISPDTEEVVEEGVLDFGMRCHSGGTLDIFIEPMTARPRLLVIGASPVAQALSELAPRVGFAVVAAFPGAERRFFPDADQVLDGFDLAPGNIGPADFVVVATQGGKDEDGLEAALSTEAFSIALIASRRKAAKLKQYLMVRGHPRARVEAISAPAGLDIGAVTPTEIALSILADLIKLRRDRRETESRQETVHPAASAVDPVCGMQVDPTTAEYQSSYTGKDYYFCCAGCKHRFDQSPSQYLAPIGGPLSFT
jgi:xanthine dehydrogenase accessory factor